MKAELEKHLIEIERKLWANDAVFYKNNLTEDCLLVFPETGVLTREVAVDAIRKENEEGRRWAEVDFVEIGSLMLADNYRVTARWAHEERAITSLASSVYVKRDDDTWRLTFHQQTPLEGG